MNHTTLEMMGPKLAAKQLAKYIFLSIYIGIINLCAARAVLYVRFQANVEIK